MNKEEKKDVLEKNWRVGEHEEIEKDVFIFLVRENFIYESQSILLVVYSNNFSENFEPILDVSPNGMM